MNGLDEVPESVNRAIVLGIVLYFTLVVYAGITADPLARDIADAVFGLIAIAVGATLYRESGGERSATLGAGVCLVLGGISQFVYLATRAPILDFVTTVAVFVGIGLYVYAIWIAD
ncbi:hypothetical protein ACFOZ7_07265 [Natribaculum luteum]|uniref:Uncharacterized protein n=1 Tax=Natribaculum luteum TaxID=1586232 RepID=A0ABD5NYJ6_9EURY|nr:hypothetical protein [Natribaculum luteum]